LLTLDDLYDPVKKVDFGGAQPTGLGVARRPDLPVAEIVGDGP